MNTENVKQLPNPFFTVIIAAYNRANLLPRALNSVIDQTEPDWEAIIIDDGSTDNTFQDIFPYLKLFPEIRYIRQPHKGRICSKNNGIKAASGRYITFLDSDDEYHPSHLGFRKSILLQDPEIIFLYGGAKIIGNQYVPDRFDVTKKIRLEKCVIGGTFFIERETALKMNGFREISFGADGDLYDRIRGAGVKTQEVTATTYVYHHETEDSVTNRMMACL